MSSLKDSLKHPEQRVLVLFDVQNLYYSAKHLYNTKVDFKQILDVAIAGRKLVRAIAYAIRAQIKEENAFHEALEKIGIEVKVKDLQIFYTGDKKGDWDIGIAMDAVRLAPKIDTVVLVSGDGDFKDLLSYLKSHGCRVEVIAFSKTASKFLKEEADDFIDLCADPGKFLIRQRMQRVRTSRSHVRNRGATGHINDESDTNQAIMHQMGPPNLARQEEREMLPLHKLIQQENLRQVTEKEQKEQNLKISKLIENEKNDAEKADAKTNAGRLASRLKRLIRKGKGND
ncbi:MAG: NYN domain-containing protein [Candidatus Woesearchaeota archaeon]